jgi:hypothetical protein
MKRFKLTQVFMLMILALAVAAGCTKEGPAGPAGADGTNGMNGTDGKDGVDGNASCIQCHTIEYMNQIEDQYAESGHSAGLYVGYAGGRKDCAMCHSHEGFVETQHTGLDTTAADIPIPTHIQCGTCHSFHETLDFENDGPDYAIRQNGPVNLMMYSAVGTEVTLDFGNNSNLCLNCHQPRRAGPEDDGTGNFTITSTHYGPHHGPQGTFLQGIGGAEIGVGYPEPGSSSHVQAGCTGCHMHEYAEGEGGHTWKVPVASCTPCHEGATTLDINGVQTEIAGLMDDLKNELMGLGVLDAEGHPVVGTYPLVQAQAFYNYAGLVDDRSNGIHNPDYIHQLVVNSINAIQ